jgi:two-component system, response regulator YesN
MGPRFREYRGRFPNPGIEDPALYVEDTAQASSQARHSARTAHRTFGAWYNPAMYRFLMVDDEEIVRRGFETKIDWEGQGFEFLPPCENGRDAIAAIERLSPDVVMTDIHMPHADGISVAAHVMESHPDIVVVVLSGYDEFQYAQAAIRNRVFDYVLKPVTSRDLSALLIKIRNKLDADRFSRDQEIHLKERAERSDGLLRGRGLAGFISGASPSSDPVEAAFLLGFDPTPFSCAAIVVELDDISSDWALAEPDLVGALARARRSAWFAVDGGGRGALLFDASKEACAALALSTAEAALEGRGRVRIGVGRAYERWEDAPKSFAEARAALAYRLIRDPSKPFVYARISETHETLTEMTSLEDRLCLGLRSGAADRAGELARSYLAALAKAEISPQRVRHEINALFSRARDELAEVGVTPEILSTKLAADYYRLTYALDRPEAIVATIERLAEISASALEPSGYHESEWKVLDFKEHVARHYGENDLSVGKAAKRLSISESYLSKLIRRKLGTSFVDYLAAYRIDRAKELLASSDMRAYEVAEAVGYPDARYFATIFKRRSGLTPAEFRASLGKRNANGGGSAPDAR